MLQTLYIENIAVIEKTTIDFGKGLNVLTGETGAGKSIVIDSINAIMGRRTSKDIIRTGADSAYVSAQFDEINDNVKSKLAEMGFEDDEETLILQRTLNKSGKSTCKINGKPATVSMLKELSNSLINIHGQHESYELFSPETHIDYIDSYGNTASLLEAYKKEYKEYKLLKKKSDEAAYNESERLREIDLLTFQCDELDKAEIICGEEEALESERTALMSFEKIFSFLSQAKLYLDDGDNGTGGVETIGAAMNSIQRACDFNPEYEEISEIISDAYYNLSDCTSRISDAIDNLESDPKRLEEIEDRLDLISRLCRKYNCSCDDLPSLAEKMQARLDELINYDRNREELIKACKEAESRTRIAAEKLSELRHKTALEFAACVKKEMSFLNMPDIELVPEFGKCEFNQKGIDKVELLISANPGEAPRPVAKIASGGELSRMMLAIKTVLANADTVDTLIFDEVDTGISGSAAEKVGLKLKEAAISSQVLCVTHQAQIAALADNHYLIKKQVEQGRTFTVVTGLDHIGRRDELARIIGGVNITQAALSHAEAMLNEYNN